MKTLGRRVPGSSLGAVLLAFGSILPFFMFGSNFPGVRAAAPFYPPVAVPASSSLVISQVYGGGGNSGALYTNDFIELFNPTASTVSVTNWSVQYSSATGGTWNVGVLTGTVTLQPGQYYLIREANGAGGSQSLPTPDNLGSIPMAATAGKVALVSNSTALTCGSVCHSDPSVVDYVGYGTTASDYEGTGPAPAPANPSSDIRAAGGCTDSNNNAGDFSVSNPPTPRNSSSAFNICAGAATATSTDTAVATVMGTPPTDTSTPILTSTSTPTDTQTSTNTRTGTGTGTPSTSTPTVTATNTSVSVSSSVYLYMVHYTSYLSQSDEGVRLINTSNSASSVGGWSIVNSSGSVTLPLTATIAPNSSIWIANSATGFSGLFGFLPDYEYGADSSPAVPQAVATGGFNFPDAGDAVRLLNSGSQNADTLVYKNGNIGTTGWSGASVKPYLPAGQPNFTEAGQIFYRKLDETTGLPVPDTNTKDDWAQDDDPAGIGTPIPGDRSNDDISGKKLLRPGWALTNPAYQDMFFTKQFTDTNVTTKFLVDPDNGFRLDPESAPWRNPVHHHRDLRVAQFRVGAGYYRRPARGVNVGIILDGNPCCTNAPDTETLWSAKQWEAAGIPVYFFSGTPNTADSNYRYNNVHAKIMVVDNQWVLTGSDNFTIGGMTNDPRGNGTGGNRGAMIITNAPDVVSLHFTPDRFRLPARRLCRHRALPRPWHSSARLFADALPRHSQQLSSGKTDPFGGQRDREHRDNSVS